MNQNLRVLPKLNIYINTPTPHAGPPEANHTKASRTEGKALPRPKPTPGHPFSRTNGPSHGIQQGTS